MQLSANFSLKPYNTFGLDVSARYFVEVGSPQALSGLLREAGSGRYGAVTILGGGSNVLFLGDVKGLVVRIGLKGIETEREDAGYVWLRAGAGEVWHDFVTYCVARGLGGLENLSLIPGTVGAAPMQNIGAYGVEVGETVSSVEVLDRETGLTGSFTGEECRFGYRESIFKHEYKGRFVIMSVLFRLKKKPEVNTGYGDIVKVLEEMGVTNPGIADVSDAVIRIRKSKLPDPAEIGNAGSFFKNPEVTNDEFAALRRMYPEIPGYPLQAGVKVPAGWLIERAGWKGYRAGNVGVHARQALVLVNYGGGTGEEIRQLAERIRNSVRDQFGISLTPEVNYI